MSRSANKINSPKRTLVSGVTFGFLVVTFCVETLYLKSYYHEKPQYAKEIQLFDPEFGDIGTHYKLEDFIEDHKFKSLSFVGNSKKDKEIFNNFEKVYISTDATKGHLFRFSFQVQPTYKLSGIH